MEKLTLFWEAYGELTVIVFACVLAVVLFAIMVKTGRGQQYSTRVITSGAMAIALAMVLNLITLFSMPQGGSVTLGRLIPLLIFAYIYGFSRGCVVGAIYGIMDFIMKPYVLTPVSFLLDYPLAFAMVGFAGILYFKKMPKISFLFGIVLAGIARFTMSGISGIMYFQASTPGIAFVDALTGSMAYNSVLLVDMAVCLVLIFALSCSKSFMMILDRQKVTA